MGSLPLALRLIEHYGFSYLLTMVWHKPGGFQPFGLPQYNCEFVIYARRGAPSLYRTIPGTVELSESFDRAGGFPKCL